MAEAPDFSLLDIRVGKIVEADNHPDSDKLFVEKVEVGEEEPRVICSGLRPFVKLEDFRDAYVLVICNLKARKVAGTVSNGMVMCVTNDDHTAVHLITPARADVKPGTRVVVEGMQNADQKPAILNPKKKIFEKAAPHLKCVAKDGKFVCVYQDQPLLADGAHLLSGSTGTIS